MNYKVWFLISFSLLVLFPGEACKHSDSSSDADGEIDGGDSGADGGSAGDSDVDSDIDSGTSVDTDSDVDSDTDPDSGSDGGDDDDDDTDSDTEMPYAEFTVAVELSSKIQTVGIVTWSIDRDSIDEAYIEFGLDTGYGMTAPVDLGELDFRTLLLGMKPSSEYHFRITARDGATNYLSDDYTVITGDVTNLIAKPTVETYDSSSSAGGFIVSTTFVSMTGGNPITFIIDADGDLVWWYQVPLSETAAARMSYDGARIGIVPVNNIGSFGKIHMVTMDGLDARTFEQDGVTHDITPTPEGGFAFYDRLPPDEKKYLADDECGKIMEISPDGSTREIYDTSDFFGSYGCHGNAVRYSAKEDIYTLGELNHNTILAISRDGDLLWALNGSDSDFTGTDWIRQHGHHLLDDSILIFNNSEDAALEFSLDMYAMTASETFNYTSEMKSMVMGDVQRLSNGNTLVTYSTCGVFHEVDPGKNLVKKVAFDGAAVGYSEWRSSLYGPGESVTM